MADAVAPMTTVANGDNSKKPNDDGEDHGGDAATSSAEEDNTYTLFGPNVHVSSHPVLSHKITILRSSQTRAGTFRAAMKEITYHLAYEATRHLKTKTVPVSVTIPKTHPPEHADCRGHKLRDRVAIVPILRSGLGMEQSMCELLPNAASYHMGLYKVKGQDPVLYFNRLPRACKSDIAYVLDPVIATASTVMSVVNILKKVSHPFLPAAIRLNGLY